MSIKINWFGVKNFLKVLKKYTVGCKNNFSKSLSLKK